MSNPLVRKDVLEADPASQLVMPGANAVYRVGAETFMNVTGPEPAFVGAIWGTSEDLEDVFDFYRRELPRLGWTDDGKGIGTTYESIIWLWCKPGMVFRLGFVDPRDYDQIPPVVDWHQFTTVFDARLQSGRSCPRT